MGEFRHFSTGVDGTVTQLKLDRLPNGKREITVKQLIPPEICNQIFKHNEHYQNGGKSLGEAVRGHTQRHRVPVAQMPQALFYQLIQKLGPPWDEGSRKNWRNWLNDPANRGWRMALGRI